MADEFLAEAEAEPGARGLKRGAGGEGHWAGGESRGALRHLAVTARARVGTWVRMVGGLPVEAMTLDGPRR